MHFSTRWRTPGGTGHCAQTDPEAFFPEGGSTREAKRICSGCEVKAECLEYALHNDERFGIWAACPSANGAASSAASSDAQFSRRRRRTPIDHDGPFSIVSSSSPR